MVTRSARFEHHVQITNTDRIEVDTTRIKAYTRIGASLEAVDDLELDQDLFFISVAARMLGMHPQTLRKYERLGLVQPTRTIGSMRLYSRDELERLRLIKRLVDDARHQPRRRAAAAVDRGGRRSGSGR